MSQIQPLSRGRGSVWVVMREPPSDGPFALSVWTDADQATAEAKRKEAELGVEVWACEYVLNEPDGGPVVVIA